MQAASARAAFAGVPEPFPGLRPFEGDEEPIFRGRQEHTDELLRRLSAHRFLAVVGTSGSGKSSLVRAGLRPALDRGYLAGATSRWRIAMMRPGMAPIENLAEALRQEEALGAADASKLRSSRLGLVEIVRDAKLKTGESLLVVADQFEELFRYQRRMSETDGGADAALFVNLLLTAAARPDAPVYVVLTMRSDFLGDCAQFPGLPEALSESQYLIPRLTREQRRQAIEEPLRLFGATMTPQLVEQLLNDSGDEVSNPGAGSRYRGGAPDPLPVLQHALMRTYMEWKALPPHEAGERIDLTQYRKAGRMESALDQHAERVFTDDLDDAGRRWAERIFCCLTTTELGRPVRRPTPLADLYKVVGAGAEDKAKIDEVLGVLQRRENSFLKVHRDTTVDISHESLIWKWKRLSGWVATEAASAELYRDLVKDANGRATWGEPKLSSALAIRKQDGWNEHWARQYSESSFEDVEAFLRRSRIAVRNQWLLRWSALLLIVTLGIWLYTEREQRRVAEAETQRQTAMADQARAIAVNSILNLGRVLSAQTRALNCGQSECTVADLREIVAVLQSAAPPPPPIETSTPAEPKSTATHDSPDTYKAVLPPVVNEIVAGIAPGPIELTGGWDILVSAADHSKPSAFVAARQYNGRGRIAAAGHEWLLVYAHPKLLDNAKFVTNLLLWLKVGSSSKVAYTTGHREWFNDTYSQTLRDVLKPSGLDLEPLPGPITRAALDGVSVLIIGNAWGDFSPDEISAVKDYVEGGNGLLLAGLGWSWAQYNPDKPYPMEQISKPYGVRWLNSVIVDKPYTNPPIFEAQFKDAPKFHTFFPNAK